LFASGTRTSCAQPHDQDYQDNGNDGSDCFHGSPPLDSRSFA
jgi:hypothetical protein